MEGEIVELEEKRKSQFLSLMSSDIMQESQAAKAMGLPITMLREWIANDADFNLAITEAKESVLDGLETSVLRGAMDDPNIGLQVLKARRPEKWNPAHRIEVEVNGHRYIDFAGEMPHEPDADVDAIEGEFERVRVEEKEAAAELEE